MSVTEQLKREHEGINLMLMILEKVCAKLESKKELNLEDFEQILEFIKVFIDKCHHGKEEDLLFPAMEEAGVPKEEGPIGVMLMEHDTGRSYVKDISEAFAKHKTGDSKASSKIIENARNYIELLNRHIDKENNILFPMADALLSAEKQEELLGGFERLEIKRIGAGRHEGFHKLLHHLKEVYLE